MNELDRILDELAQATGEQRRRLIDQHLSRLPLLRSTVLDLIAQQDGAGLETGGALAADASTGTSESAMSLAPGDTLGSIRIEGPLGEGGMGQVMLGHDGALDRRVAIKTLRGALALRPGARARFEREAKILSRLRHPAICQIHGLLEKDGAQHLVLEFVEGTTLRAAAPSLDRDASLRVVETVAQALEAAHAEGVVHRDLKPDNLMVTESGQVKVLDFGIARVEPSSAARGGDAGADPRSSAAGEAVAETSPPLTRLGALLGTIAYMSPEQARGEAAGPASDLYSLGLILHELCSSTPPLPADLSAVAILDRISAGRLDPPTGVDADLEKLLARLCHIDPKRRGTAEDLRRDMAAILDAPNRRRRRRWRRAAASAVVAALASAAAAVVQARWNAEREAVRVERFSREAAEVVWRLRALELSPRHGVGPAVDRLRVQLLDLEGELEGDTGPADAAGRRSLGRAFFALGDLDAALRHLESADASDPETAWWLGRAYGERYREALVSAAAIGHAALRDLAVEEAEAAWRDRAVAALERSRAWPDADPHLLEALLAFYGDRFEDASQSLAEARGEGPSRRPWSVDSALLAGDVAWRRAQKESWDRADAEGYDAGLLAAQGHYRRAVSVARSSASAHGRLCRTAAERMRVALSKRIRSVPAEEIEALGRLCAAAGDVDGEHADVQLAVATAHQVAAAARGEPAAGQRKAIEGLSTKSRGEHSGVERVRLRGLIGADLAYQLVWAGELDGDLRTIIEHAARDLEAVWSARADPAAARGLGNLRMVDSFRAGLVGEDPMTPIEAALPILDEALRRYPQVVDLHTTLGNVLLAAGRHQFQIGESAVDAYTAAAEAFAVGAEAGDMPARSNLVLVLGDLGLAQARVGDDPLETWERAFDIAADALIEDPEHRTLWGYRGVVYYRFGEYRLHRGEDPTEALLDSLDSQRREVALGSDSADTQLAIRGFIPLLQNRWHLLHGEVKPTALKKIDDGLRELAPALGGQREYALAQAAWHIQRGWTQFLRGADPERPWSEAEAMITEPLARGAEAVPWLRLAVDLDILRARRASTRSESSRALAAAAASLRGHLEAIPRHGISRAERTLLEAVACDFAARGAECRELLERATALDASSGRQLRLLAPELAEPLGVAD